MTYLVYCYTNKLNNKKYIGITSRSIEERESSHIYESRNKSNKCYNSPFKRAIRKYGIDGFTREIIDAANSLEDACELEKYYIRKFKTYFRYKNSNGYNATLGGELLQMPKDRVVQIDCDTLNILKIWDSVSSAEHCLGGDIYTCVSSSSYERIARNCYWIYENEFNKETYKEEVYIKHNYICQISKDDKLINIWRSAKIASDNLKISQGNISMCCLGYRVSTHDFYWCYYGDYINKKYPIKNPDTNKKSVIQFEQDGRIVKVWESITDASISLKINISDISSACKNYKSAGSYLWRLCDEYDGEEVTYINERKTRVEKLDNNQNVVCSYSSIGEAANDVGVKYPGICRAIKNGCRSGGFYWRKVSEV